MAGLEGSKLDHYRLDSIIGRGGMSTVYKATDTRTGDAVAVKVLSQNISGDRRFVRRFRREGGLVSRLNHPHIVSVTDYGEYQGMIYLVMPFLEGDSLHSRLGAARIHPEEAARWITQVSEALEFAHNRGVIHRDVKPGNILIDLKGDAHLADFGLARMIEGTNTLTGSALIGTPSYMSPEQARGKTLDSRADQYSLGVIIYQMTTGQLPFEAETPMGTALMHIQDPVPLPSRLNPNVSPGLERVILTAMAKRRDDRFPTIAKMSQAYLAALRGEALEWLKAPSADIQAKGIMAATPPAVPGRSRWVPWALSLVFAGVVIVRAFASPALGSFLFGPSEGAQPSVAPEEPANPTETLPPPTPTALPTPVPPVTSPACPGLSLIGFERRGNDVVWSISNGTGQVVEIQGVFPGYPPSNPPIEIILGAKTLWQLPTDATLEPDEKFTIDQEDGLTVADSELKEIMLRFAWAEIEKPYALRLAFDVGCTLEARW